MNVIFFLGLRLKIKIPVIDLLFTHYSERKDTNRGNYAIIGNYKSFDVLRNARN